MRIIRNLIAQCVIRLFMFLVKRLSSVNATNIISDVLYYYSEHNSPKRVVHFLMLLDNNLYALQGRSAIAYGGGIHTKHKHIRYHDFFIGRVDFGEKVLDVGCGIGAVSRKIVVKKQCTSYAIDLDSSKIELARYINDHPNIEYVVGDALTDLPDRGFDVVVLSNVLEHLPGRVNFLQKLAGATKAKRFLIRVPLFERDWRVPLKKELGLEWRLDKTHETEYTLESFSKEIKQAGLLIVHQEVRWGEIWAEVIPDAP